MQTAVDPVPLPSPDALWGETEEPFAVRCYRQMLSIRRFEENLLALFDEGVLNGTTHCCIGQEADCVGVGQAIRRDDHVFSNHRCHGHYLAHTGDAFGLLTEIMGKQAGMCGGVGGSQHICAPHFKSNGILGGTVAAAAGIAWGLQLDRSEQISVVFMGDGVLGEGLVYETLNAAKLWQLPLMLVVENNEWSQSTPIASNLAGSIAGRFAAFDIPVTEISSTDVQSIHTAASNVQQRVRTGNGPHALVINTYRFCSHSKNDDARPAQEIAARREFDPLTVQQARLEPDQVTRVAEEVETVLRDLTAQAKGLA